MLESLLSYKSCRGKSKDRKKKKEKPVEKKIKKSLTIKRRYDKINELSLRQRRGP